MEEKYTETFKSWNNIAPFYEEALMDLKLYDDTYKLFCELMPKSNASILEIGCGPGNITRYLLRQNPQFKITATDIAENMLALAKKHNPSANFLLLDCRKLSTLNEKYDAIVSGFTLPYLSEADAITLFKDCQELLNSGGIFYLSFIPGDYNKSGYMQGSTGDRVYFYYHESEKIKAQLNTCSFNVLHEFEKQYQKADGTTETHVVIICEKIVD